MFCTLQTVLIYGMKRLTGLQQPQYLFVKKKTTFQFVIFVIEIIFFIQFLTNNFSFSFIVSIKISLVCALTRVPF